MTHHHFVLSALLLSSLFAWELRADYATTVQESAPLAWYRFEEGEGAAEIVDSSGNGHVGFEVNDVEFGRAGIDGSLAAEFLGMSSILLDFYLDPADPEGDGIGTGNDDFTIESWVYPTGTEDDPANPGEQVIADQQVYVAQKDGAGLGRSDMLVTLDRQFGTFISGGTRNALDPLENDPVIPEQWYHLVMTVDGINQEIYFYINGEPSPLNPQYPTANGIESADGEWVIGSHKNQAGQFYTGLLDEIAFYDYRLDDPDGDDNTSDSRIILHYQAAGFGGEGTAGDYDGDGLLTALDIDQLNAAIRNGQSDTMYDLSGDGSVNADDRNYWVEQLKRTYIGDANLDGEFNSSDLVFVFTKGQYEDGVPGNSTWESGDWDGNGEFDSSDFVAAFTAGGYEAGPRTAVAAVPEPASCAILLAALCAIGPLRRRVAQAPSVFLDC